MDFKYAAEFGSTGSLEISWFHGSSSGKSRLPPRLAFGPSLMAFSPPTASELNGWIYSSLDLGRIRQLLEIDDEYVTAGV